MWRVIIRISFFHDTGSRLRNHLAPMFNTTGLQNTLTGTWAGLTHLELLTR